jgi:short-subunit dehydrogenase
MSKIAIVTGASSGIGKSAAMKLNNAGFTVYGLARRVESMSSLKKKGIHTLYMDITNEESVNQAFKTIITETGRVDVLVNNAGYGMYGSVEETSIEDARHQFEVNIFGLSRLTQMIIPFMRKNGSGRIINISSIGGRAYAPFGAYYHATKHALEGFSDCLRVELNPFNIKVVVIQPGFIESEWSGIATENLIKNSEKGVYARSVRKYADIINDIYQNQKASHPDVIGDIIIKAATKKNPRIRYVAGKHARVILTSRKILSYKAFDNILLKQLKN